MRGAPGVPRSRLKTTIEVSRVVRDRLSRVSSETGMTYSDIISMLLDAYEYLSKCRPRKKATGSGAEVVWLQCVDQEYALLPQHYEALRRHIPFLPRFSIWDLVMP